MDPQSLAMLVSPLVAKAAAELGESLLDAVAEDTANSSWAALKGIAQKVRDWFSSNADSEATAALDLLIAAPDSASTLNRLATVLEDRLREAPSVASELEKLVSEVSASATPDVARFVVNVQSGAKVGKLVQIDVVNTERFQV